MTDEHRTEMSEFEKAVSEMKGRGAFGKAYVPPHVTPVIEEVEQELHTAHIAAPQWGEEAAQAIIKMADERAKYIEAFATSIVERADKWNELASQLADNIRETAQNEAAAIRSESARMERAGEAIGTALADFEAGTKINGKA